MFDLYRVLYLCLLSVAMAASLPSTSAESNWPGERDPSHNDVQVANEVPESAFLSDFKRRLMSSCDASGNQSLMHLDLHVRDHEWHDPNLR